MWKEIQNSHCTTVCLEGGVCDDLSFNRRDFTFVKHLHLLNLRHVNLLHLEEVVCNLLSFKLEDVSEFIGDLADKVLDALGKMTTLQCLELNSVDFVLSKKKEKISMVLISNIKSLKSVSFSKNALPLGFLEF